MNEVGTAIRSAVDFLSSARNRRGWWDDFDTLAGPSDEWVTAYVGMSLAAVPDSRAATLARQAWGLLRRRRWWSAGWGYNRVVPADADSTAWALLLADAVGAEGSTRIRRAQRFLARHVHHSGGLATYAREGPMRHFTQLSRRVSFRGWCGPHVCVTAAAASVPRFSGSARMNDYLRATQGPDGGWSGYWWPDREYATWLAVEALAKDGGEDAIRVASAVQWATRRIATDGSVASAALPAGSPFATACCLQILRHSSRDGTSREPVDRVTRWLLTAQKADGSWESSAALRIPPPDVEAPDQYTRWRLNGKGGGSIVMDQRSLFTTATVLRSLSASSNSTTID